MRQTFFLLFTATEGTLSERFCYRFSRTAALDSNTQCTHKHMRAIYLLRCCRHIAELFFNTNKIKYVEKKYNFCSADLTLYAIYVHVVQRMAVSR